MAKVKEMLCRFCGSIVEPEYGIPIGQNFHDECKEAAEDPGDDAEDSFSDDDPL